MAKEKKEPITIATANYGYITIVCEILPAVTSFGGFTERTVITVSDTSIGLRLGRIVKTYPESDACHDADNLLMDYVAGVADIITAYNGVRALRGEMPAFRAKKVFRDLAHCRLFNC